MTCPKFVSDPIEDPAFVERDRRIRRQISKKSERALRSQIPRCGAVHPGRADLVCRLPPGHVGKHQCGRVRWNQVEEAIGGCLSGCPPAEEACCGKGGGCTCKRSPS